MWYDFDFKVHFWPGTCQDTIKVLIYLKSGGEPIKCSYTHTYTHTHVSLIQYLSIDR
jgi:hypothetical protein